MSDFPFLIPESDELKRLYKVEELVQNVMENDLEGIEKMSVEMAADILGCMRGDDEDGKIPSDLTAEEFAEIWNELKEIQEDEH
jgi:hypothetical protein